MKYLAAVRKMDAERAMKEIPALGQKLFETMGESMRVVTSVHPDARRMGRIFLRQYQLFKGDPGIVPERFTVRFQGDYGEIVREFKPFEPECLQYLSESNGTHKGRYDGDRTKLLQTLEMAGSQVDGLIVVPDYPVYCDITKLFKGQEFQGSGRHRIPSLDEAAATLFDLKDKRIRYL